MEDRFKQELRDLRDDLDRVEEPNRERIWQAIQQQRQLQRTIRHCWMAAAALLCLLSGGIAWHYLYTKPQPEAVALLDAKTQQRMAAYEQAIATKRQLIDASDNSGIKQRCSAEVAVVQSDRQRLAEEVPLLRDASRYEQLLTRYYEHEIRILDLFLKEIDFQHHEKERLAHLRS